MLLSTSIFLSTLRRRISLPHRRTSLRHLHAPPQLTYPLSHPIYTIWASNTSLGKTLLSTGLSISFLLSPPSPSPKKFIYLKPIQTGFPLDSDSRFVFEKFSKFFLLSAPPFSASASNTVLKTSIPASKSILGNNDYRSNVKGMVDLGYFEERRLEGGSNSIMSAELVCKTMYGWKEAVSPHLAAEREEAVVEDGEVLEMLSRCLFVDSREEEEDVDVMCVVETAGGVASPGPSGSLQCDLFRYE